ncbi:MAG: hypothetical protein QXD80_06730 [Acidilobaceae archaeon]
MFDYAKLVCSSRECMEDVDEIISVYSEIIKPIVKSTRVKVELRSEAQPIIFSIDENTLRDIVESIKAQAKSRGIDFGDIRLDAIRSIDIQEAQSIVSFIARRVLYESLRDKHLDLRHLSGRCPICGLYPILGLFKRERGEVFSRDVIELRCLCGYSYALDQYVCPVCGNSDKKLFNLYIIGEVTYRVCTRCNHTLGVIREFRDIDLDLLTLIVAYGLILLSKSLSGT